jgi:hypothetical protein
MLIAIECFSASQNGIVTDTKLSTSEFVPYGHLYANPHISPPNSLYLPSIATIIEIS